MCGTRGGQAAGGVERVAMVRSRDRCLLLRFTMLLGLVRGSLAVGLIRKVIKDASMPPKADEKLFHMD